MFFKVFIPISLPGTIIKKKPVPAPTPKPKPVVEEKPQPLPPQPHVDPLYPPAMLAAQAPPVAAKKAPPPAPPKRINSQISENGMPFYVKLHLRT